MLRGRPAGIEHAARDGVWLMFGRSIPSEFQWCSVPPAPSLSLLWGEGECRIVHGGAEVTIRHGEAFWVDAGYPHRGFGAAGSDFVTLFVPGWVGLSGLAGVGAVALGAPAQSTLVRVAADILSARGPGFAVEALQELLPAFEAVVSGQRLLPASVRRARATLDDTFRKSVGLTALAARSGLSRHHTSRVFSGQLGVPATQYRKQLRLLAATRALLDGETVSKAAADAGFSDPAHLSRTFRRQYGITPSDWQRRVRPGLAPPALAPSVGDDATHTIP